MSTLAQSDAFKSIILNHTPLIDVRAPIEFAKGAFPNSVNLPLMSDEERHLVGICYKKQGNEKAIELGHSLVSGDTKKGRIEAWQAFIRQNSDAMLYCFRGGERSQISQRWLTESGIDIVRLQGGYKAFRQYLLDILESSPKLIKPIVLGGRTGSGKTILLQELENMIDLEAIANHRGSSFGRHITAQPSQIDFENILAYKMLEQIESDFSHIIFEDEGRNIGKNYLPHSFANVLLDAPLIILEREMEERLEITFDEYVVAAQKSYSDFDNPVAEWSSDMMQAMARIAKRLGGLRYKKLIGTFENATNIQQNEGSLDAHKEWIVYLFKEYYDPMYDYQIIKRSEQIVFRGNYEEVLEECRRVARLEQPSS